MSKGELNPLRLPKKWASANSPCYERSDGGAGYVSVETRSLKYLYISFNQISCRQLCTTDDSNGMQEVCDCDVDDCDCDNSNVVVTVDAKCDNATVPSVIISVL